MINSEDKDQQIVKNIAREIINHLIENPDISRRKINNLKNKINKKFCYNKVIKNSTILNYATEIEKSKISKLLKIRTTRTLSGVSIIAIMTKPLPCPGTCIFCPGPTSQPGPKVAQSYTGREPAAMRSICYDYDSYKQTSSRIRDLEAIGHKVDKIELLILGGTFLSTDVKYQEQFVQGALEGVIEQRANSLEEAKKLAESSKRRLIGITIETRPDYCRETDVDKMLNYGTTRVELGIQTVFDDIYRLIKRGHTTKESINAIRIARDAGLKINAHIMPNLPGSNYSKDLKTFDILFSNPEYRPDMLKIYPCLVVKGTELYEWWIQEKYTPYSLEELIDLIANVKINLPPYVRIQRIMRDIPAYLIEAGCKKSNLRQLVMEKLKKSGNKCNCIRCREYGFSKHVDNEIIEALSIQNIENIENVQLCRLDYEASQGNEIFLSYENKKENYIIGYLRLRKPSEFAHRPELNDGKTTIVREIKVVGELVPKDTKPDRLTQIQHRGFGKMLMKVAEKVSAEDFDAKKIAVISGIGARDWFYDLDYELDGPYVSKKLP